jgi:hypothetical protein
MSKFKCTCGFMISDGSHPNSVTGLVLSCESDDVFHDSVVAWVTELLNCQKQGKIADWYAKHLPHWTPQKKFDDEIVGMMVSDMLIERLGDVGLDMMECDDCGRLWIREGVRSGDYRSYSPDDAAESRMKVLGLNQAPTTLTPPT